MTPTPDDLIAERAAVLRDRGIFDVVQGACVGITVEDVLGPGRTKAVSASRQRAWAALQAIGLSFKEIGALFGRDHSTVITGVRKARASMAPARCA